MAESKISEEITDIKKRLSTLVPACEIIGAHHMNVQIRVVRTKYKQCMCQFQFPPGYPDTPILIEIKSKQFNEKVVNAMVKLAEEEAKKLVGRPQIISLMKFIWRFLEENPLLLCAAEISDIKKSVVIDQDQFKVKQKHGVISYDIKKNNYQLDVRLTIPDGYPADPVSIEFKRSNFPPLLETHFIAQAREIARQCTQPPIKPNPRAPPFEAKRSLKQVIQFLSSDCVHKFAVDCCPICKKPALPRDPKDTTNDPNGDMFVEWVYCGHIFHHRCMDNYMKTPPFTGGKKCPACGSRIYHEKWNISPECAEERWAHKEARDREVEECAEFLDLM